MKTHYPGFYKPTNEAFAELWQNATVVFDTNVLLDLYRVSNETAKKLIEMISYFADKDRVFVPCQVALEYHRNLLDTILMQKAKYSDALKCLKDFERKISEKRNHPYLSAKLKERFSSLLTDIESSFKEQTIKIDKIITQPSIKDELATLLDGKVGDGFPKEELEKIKEEGAIRYAAKIPPGFKDADKSSDNQYGDLVIWKEVLEFAKQQQVGIIYVSSDVKDDWYLRLHGITYGPHPDLIKEFEEYTNQSIYLYSLDLFLLEANKQKVADIPKDSLDEVENVIRTKRDLDLGNLFNSAFMKTSRDLKNEDAQSSLDWSGLLDEMLKSKNASENVTGSLKKDSLSDIFANNIFGSLK